MKRTVVFTLALLCGAIFALGCVVEDKNAALTPLVPPTAVRPTLTAPPVNSTPRLPAPPVAPAAGTYFGLLGFVDQSNLTVSFSALCLGADRKVMKELALQDKSPHLIPLKPTTALSIFSAPPNNPAAGRVTPVDLATLAEVAKNNPGAKYFLVVDPAGVTALEQDTGIRSTAQPDDPCPHG